MLVSRDRAQLIDWIKLWPLRQDAVPRHQELINSFSRRQLIRRAPHCGVGPFIYEPNLGHQSFSPPSAFLRGHTIEYLPATLASKCPTLVGHASGREALQQVDAERAKQNNDHNTDDQHSPRRVGAAVIGGLLIVWGHASRLTLRAYASISA